MPLLPHIELIIQLHALALVKRSHIDMGCSALNRDGELREEPRQRRGHVAHAKCWTYEKGPDFG